MPAELKAILMRRDGLTADEADDLIRDARREVARGADPEEILLNDFGLEPDFIFDLI